MALSMLSFVRAALPINIYIAIAELYIAIWMLLRIGSMLRCEVIAVMSSYCLSNSG